MQPNPTNMPPWLADFGQAREAPRGKSHKKALVALAILAIGAGIAFGIPHSRKVLCNFFSKTVPQAYKHNLVVQSVTAGVGSFALGLWITDRCTKKKHEAHQSWRSFDYHQDPQPDDWQGGHEQATYADGQPPHWQGPYPASYDPRAYVDRAEEPGRYPPSIIEVPTAHMALIDGGPSYNPNPFEAVNNGTAELQTRAEELAREMPLRDLQRILAGIECNPDSPMRGKFDPITLRMAIDILSK